MYRYVYVYVNVYTHIYSCLSLWCFSVRPRCIHDIPYSVFCLQCIHYSKDGKLLRRGRVNRKWKSSRACCASLSRQLSVFKSQELRLAREVKRSGPGGRTLDAITANSTPTYSEAPLGSSSRLHTYVRFALSSSQN